MRRDQGDYLLDLKKVFKTQEGQIWDADLDLFEVTMQVFSLLD